MKHTCILKLYKTQLLNNTRYFVFVQLNEINNDDYKLYVYVDYVIGYSKHKHTAHKVHKFKSQNCSIMKILYIPHTYGDYSELNADITVQLSSDKLNIVQLQRIECEHFIEKAHNCEIKNMYISKSLAFVQPLVERMYENIDIIKDVSQIDRSNVCIYFGIYQHIDELKAILNHKSKCILLWGGYDIKYINDNKHNDSIKRLIEELNDQSKYINVSISCDITQSLQQIGLHVHKQTLLSFVDLRVFKPATKGNKIYIYSSSTRPDVYGESVYNKVIEWCDIKKYEYVLNTDHDIQLDNMYEYYKQFYIALRLTGHDGNANTVEELGCMGICCVHNGDMPNCLKWNSVSDIKQHIEQQRTSIGECNYQLGQECRKLLEKTRRKETWNIYYCYKLE